MTNYVQHTTATQIRAGTMGINVYVSLAMLLLANTLALSFTNFQLRRGTAIMFLCFFAIHYTMQLLQSVDLMHGFGTDHFFDAMVIQA